MIAIAQKSHLGKLQRRQAEVQWGDVDWKLMLIDVEDCYMD